MNVLKGHISKIQTHGSISLVLVTVASTTFSAVVIETPESASYLKVGNDVNVLFKETEVVIGKGATDHISLQNKIRGELMDLENGVLLSKLFIKADVGTITAMITTKAVKQLNLINGETVTAMIKTNEIMLSPC